LLNTEQFDAVFLLLVELTGSVVISLSRSCRQMMRGQAPKYFFLDPPLVQARQFITHTPKIANQKQVDATFAAHSL